MADSGIIYGETNSYKSTACVHFSRYIYELTGKLTLALITDTGSSARIMQPEIDAGLINAYRCNTQVPLPVLRRISQGYWPANPEETEISKTDFRRVDWAKYGGLIYDGLTSSGSMTMRHLADKGIKTGEEATSRFDQKIMVDGKVEVEAFAGNSRGHYGFVQNNIYSLITNLTSLPCRYVLFTALESRTEEDDRTTVYGPAVPGKKATNQMPSWVGDLIHAQTYPVETLLQVPDPADPKKRIESKVIDMQVRMYFRKHPDPSTGILFPAKPRVPPMKVGELYERYPGGFFVPTPEAGFDQYLKVVDELSASQAANVSEWRRQVDARFGRNREQVAQAVYPEVYSDKK